MASTSNVFHVEPQQRRVNPHAHPTETDYHKGFRDGFLAARELLMPLVGKVVPQVLEPPEFPTVDTFRYKSIIPDSSPKPGYEQLYLGGH